MSDFLTKVLHTIDDPVFVKDENHCYITANKAFCDWIGINVNEVKGTSDKDYFNEAEVAFFIKKDKEIFATGEHQEIEEIVTKHSGESLVCRTKKSIFIDENGQKVLVGIIRDIDKLKKTEELLKEKTVEAEAANRAKSLFLANMSHEIRTPLNAIIGFTDLLVRDPQREDKEQLLKGLQYSGKSLFTLLDNILDISKIEAGKEVLHLQSFDLKELVEEVYQQFAPQIKEKQLQWECHYFSEDQILLQSDPTRLKQILINLVSNAVKFTNNGFIHLDVALDKKTLTFHLSDTGIGVSREFEHDLFDVFSRATELEKIQGAGLGLSITKKIVELFGGTISYQPNQPKGSVFSFTLPYKKGKSIPEVIQRFIVQKGLHVLVGEDNTMNQLLISKMLEHLGHTYTIVGDGLEVIKKLNFDPTYDLILLDIRMPILDGYSAYKIIKETPNLVHLPVIALTANTLKEDIEKIKQLGMTFVSKPVDVDKLGKAIETSVKNSAINR